MSIPLAISLAALSLTVTEVAGQQSRATVPYDLSHLSPLIQYTPAAIDDSQTTWVVDRLSHRSTTANASISYQFWGGGVYFMGNGSNITAEDFRPRDVDVPMSLRVGGIYSILEATGFFPLKNYTAVVKLPNADGRQSVSLSAIQVTTTIPANFTE